jgi:hypothetical protein
MPKGLLFWILMILWLILGLWAVWPITNFGLAGGNLLLFILLGLLGWKVFGPPLQ